MTPEQFTLCNEFADFIETIPDENWRWSTVVSVGFTIAFGEKGKVPEHYCDSIGCAIGHIPLFEPAQRDGWSYVKTDYITLELQWNGNGTDNLQNVSKWLGITETEANEVFFSPRPDSSTDITQKMVADELRAVALHHRPHGA